MARILVVGASGFIGRRLIEQLIKTDEVIAVAFESGPTSGAEGVEWIRWDIRAPIPQRLLPGRLDAVAHLAQAREYRRFPELASDIAMVNLNGLINVLEAARTAGAARVVFASSGGVYQAGPGLRKESHPPAPPNFYLATKLAGELLATGYRSFFDVVSLRLFFPYGLGQPATRFIPDLVRRVVAGEPVQVQGSDGLKANPVHLEDAVTALGRALALEGSHLINVAGPEVLTLRQMVELIGEQVGRPPVLDEAGVPGSRDLVADITLMKRLLGAPKSRFQDRISEVCREATSTIT